MKNTFFVLIICLFPILVKAQEEGKITQLGFTLTPNIAWLSSPASSSDETSQNPRAGFSYGVVADIGFAKNYFFGTGFTLTTINSSSETRNFASTESTNKLSYIEVPLSLKLKSNATETGRFYGQFGLGTGIKVRATQDYKYIDEDGNNAEGNNVNISKNVNPLRLSLIAGAGAEWNIGRNLSVLTGVTFNNGFTDVFKDDDRRNSYFSLNLGVFF